MLVAYVRSTAIVDSRALRSIIMVASSSQFSGPITRWCENFTPIPLHNFAWWDEERLSFPIYTSTLFIQMVTNQDPPFVSIFLVLTWSITYCIPNCYLLLPKVGVMFHSFTEIHVCSAYQVPWKAEDSSFCSLKSAVLLHHQALPWLVHIRDHLLMHWERRKVGGLITIYQNWSFAISLWVEGNHCQLLWEQCCFLSA